METGSWIGAQLSLFGATIAGNRAAWALELDGTAGLRVEGSILSHEGGPLLWNTGEPTGTTVRIRDTVLHGDATGVDTGRNHVGDPRLSASYRPAEGSIARGKLLALPASWSSRDLLGRTRPTKPTLGALE